MKNSEKVYTTLCLFFVSLMLLGNLTYQKFVVLQIFQWYRFELSVGAILYPLTFLLSDLIAEFYGQSRATFCVRAGLAMNIFVAMILVGMDALPATDWSKVDDATFHQVFGMYALAFVGSIIACGIAQTIDVRLYLWIRQWTKGKYLWLRSNGSTAVSLLVDTTIVISTLTIFGVLPQAQMLSLIINSYAWKLSFALCSTPLFYLAIRLLAPWLRK